MLLNKKIMGLIFMFAGLEFEILKLFDAILKFGLEYVRDYNLSHDVTGEHKFRTVRVKGG